MKILSIIVFLIFWNIASAIDRPCGEYKVVAKVEMKEGFPVLLVNPYTKSQITLRTIHSERAKLTPYLDRHLKAKIKISEAFDSTLGKFELIENIEEALADPLANSLGTSLSLQKKNNCKKSK